MPICIHAHKYAQENFVCLWHSPLVFQIRMHMVSYLEKSTKQTCLTYAEGGVK